MYRNIRQIITFKYIFLMPFWKIVYNQDSASSTIDFPRQSLAILSDCQGLSIHFILLHHIHEIYFKALQLSNSLNYRKTKNCVYFPSFLLVYVVIWCFKKASFAPFCRVFLVKLQHHSNSS